jgi:hypothetical protein
LYLVTEAQGLNQVTNNNCIYNFRNIPEVRLAQTKVCIILFSDIFVFSSSIDTVCVVTHLPEGGICSVYVYVVNVLQFMKHGGKLFLCLTYELRNLCPKPVQITGLPKSQVTE